MNRLTLNKKLGTRIVGISKDAILIENLMGKFQVRHIDTLGLEDRILMLAQGVEVPDQSSNEADQRFSAICRELEKRKFLVSPNETISLPELPFVFEKLGIEKKELDRVLNEKKVLIVSDFEAAFVFMDKLKRRGVRAILVTSVKSAADLREFDLVISLLKDSHSLASEKMYEYFYQESSSYLNLEVQYAGYILGPFLKKNHTPCLCCLSRRRDARKDLNTMPIEEPLVDEIIFENLFNTATLETLRILSKTENLHLASGLFVTDVLNCMINYHEIWPIPNCLVCNTTLNNPRSFYEF